MGKHKNSLSEKFSQYYTTLGNISVCQAAKDFCKKHKIKYNDNVRRNFSKAIRVRGMNNEDIEQSKDFKTAQKRDFKKSKFYIITSAQNATPVDKNFLENMEAYRDYLGAELVVIATRYKNPTSVFVEKKDDWWAQEIKPYLTAKRLKIHDHLQVLADIKISPTASNPLSGLHGVSGIESCILGHPRVHLKSLPVLDGFPKKILLTTGMCTVANYTDSKAGKKGEFHHNLGFVIVEIKDKKTFFVRHVVANKTGGFYDLRNNVHNGVVQKTTENLPAIILGDIHLGNHNQQALNRSLEMAKEYKAEHVVLHDLFDGYTINPHEKKSPFVLAEKEELTLKHELDCMKRFLTRDLNFVVVRSNHDEFLDRHLNDSDWRRENNRKIYLELANKKIQGEMPDGVIPYYVRKAGHTALGINDSFVVKNCDLGMHGHVGASGSRGSANQFKNLNTKNVTGHSHTPIRIDGHCSVGTLSKLRQGYNKGLSSWLHCNVLLHIDGARQQIILINGEYSIIK